MKDGSIYFLQFNETNVRLRHDYSTALDGQRASKVAATMRGRQLQRDNSKWGVQIRGRPRTIKVQVD